MLDGLKQKIAAAGLKSVLVSLATNKNTQTTITGMIAGTILAVQGLDLQKLIAGDPAQIGHVAAGLAIMAIGILATRRGQDGHTTTLGVLGGALYSMQGQISDLICGMTIALVGYLTNKPAEGTPEK
jgi:hypothetical protein